MYAGHFKHVKSVEKIGRTHRRLVPAGRPVNYATISKRLTTQNLNRMLRCVRNPANPSGMRSTPSFSRSSPRGSNIPRTASAEGDRRGWPKRGPEKRKQRRIQGRTEGCCAMRGAKGVRGWKETTRHRVHRSVLNFPSMVWVKSFPAEEQALRTYRRTSRFPPRANSPNIRRLPGRDDRQCRIWNWGLKFSLHDDDIVNHHGISYLFSLAVIFVFEYAN